MDKTQKNWTKENNKKRPQRKPVTPADHIVQIEEMLLSSAKSFIEGGENLWKLDGCTNLKPFANIDVWSTYRYIKTDYETKQFLSGTMNLVVLVDGIPDNSIAVQLRPKRDDAALWEFVFTSTPLDAVYGPKFRDVYKNIAEL